MPLAAFLAMLSPTPISFCRPEVAAGLGSDLGLARKGSAGGMWLFYLWARREP